MKRLLLLCAAALALHAPAQTHRFAIEADHFTLDGKPYKVLSGELHYARIPREYWHARLKMARAMGLNTVATYVFWNVHEPTPGHYDFSGQNDVAAFIRTAQEEGLHVILRTGPYSCAEWDLGGLPPWLLADPQSAAAIRSNDPAFMVPAERWLRRLAQELTPLQVGRGGPILMTQIENEYGNFGPVPTDDPHAYMAHLKEIFLSAGFTDSLLFSGDNWRNIPKGYLDGLFAATNFGISNAQGGTDAIHKLRPNDPIFVSEYWPGWFDHWGHPHETRPTAPQLEDIDYILTHGSGINLYMFHGGTSFGFMAGSSYIGGNFLPDVTSYDYDAPLDESGRPTPKYFAYRKVFAKFACPDQTESCLPAVPTPLEPIAIPTVILASAGTLWDHLPNPIQSEQPQSMEHFGQSYGYILYRHQLTAPVSGDLVLNEVHDYARIYLEGKLAGTLDRRDKQTSLPITTTAPARLDILVANDGRVNSTHTMRTELKGITKSVTLAGAPLTDWQVFPLPMPEAPARHAPGKDPDAPQILTATFELQHPGDTFLDIHFLGKGAIWLNGHPLGRFWNAGPQQTLYVPAPWLKAGTNTIVAVDLLPQPHPSVTGLDHPILDGPTAANTHSKQE
ncbi:glycoside hydrolase family 35 protein [Granulicella sibirica]|uniref:Beta-galactosidase n=1 Tax=Granulicella sibirica TaxID=2479048 RepID=A0A4Q0SZ10_9BACT|nr:beta-galactosidase [Granulicella sibirica]RXH55240.1 Beta-galactosidase [Granulicella sibirica]